MSVRVLIVDDSGFFRRRLAEIISSDPLITVVGMAVNGKHAIEQVKLLKPDVITMDLEMPVMDGITAIQEIMAVQPTPILMLSTWTTDGAKSALDALDAGAIDYMPKRFEDISIDSKVVHQQLCQRIRKLAQSQPPRPLKTKQASAPVIKPTAITSTKNAIIKQPSSTISIVAIGTSTGGPVALQTVLTQLPASFPYPILLIQHMPATFTPSFAERLNSQCKIRVKQAENGDKLSAGTAYLAPGGMQMTLAGSEKNPHLEIKESLSTHTYKPCIDTTFESLAKVAPNKTLAIILTGMGADGREGCRSLKQGGATIWAQDEKSSTIYGMPKAIIDAKLADAIFSINDIGHQLSELK